MINLIFTDSAPNEAALRVLLYRLDREGKSLLSIIYRHYAEDKGDYLVVSFILRGQ